MDNDVSYQYPLSIKITYAAQKTENQTVFLLHAIAWQAVFVRYPGH
tara:strand:- start:125 stop:262 length:138 start_codon:yes stop_codon:yes gene_type:complete